MAAKVKRAEFIKAFIGAFSGAFRTRSNVYDEALC